MNYKYEIRQTNNRNYVFMSFDFAMNHGFSLADYETVYKGKIEADNVNHALNKLWEIFNINHPADYRARSLSMSDLVIINNVTYYCDRFDWSEIPTEVKHEEI